jgi:hypothetical protein
MAAAYHAQSNDMVEKTPQQLTDMLQAPLACADWPLPLPWVLGIHAALKEDSRDLRSATLALPGSLIEAEVHLLEKLRSAPPVPATKSLKYVQAMALVPQPLLRVPFVYIRKGSTVASFYPLYAAGLYRVLKKPKVFSGGGRKPRRRHLSVLSITPPGANASSASCSALLWPACWAAAGFSPRAV